MVSRPYRLGVMFAREGAPEELIPFAHLLEEGGADDMWLVEDLGWAGSVASAATALAATSRIRLGIGLAPAPLRNPALAAMEFAALARLHPGRLAVGMGHGVTDWMRQVGAAVPSPMALLEETVLAVRGLLGGEAVTLRGRAVSLDGVTLVHPPRVVPPVLVGGVGPRTLRLAGRVGQGVLLIEGLSPRRVADALALVTEGRAEAGAADQPQVPFETAALVYAHVTEDADAAARVVSEVQASSASFLGIEPVEVVVASGPGEVVLEQLMTLVDAGVETLVVHLMGPDQAGQVGALLAARRT